MTVISKDLFFKEAESLLSYGKPVELRVTGTSMHPYLRGNGNEIIIVSAFTPEELKVGQIVLFRYEGNHIFHRIIKRKGNSFIIQGDGVVKKQEEVLLSDIIGVVRSIIRPSGKSVSVDRRSHRLYWRCWLLLHPLRRYLLAVYRLFHRQQ